MNDDEEQISHVLINKEFTNDQELDTKYNDQAKVLTPAN